MTNANTSTLSLFNLYLKPTLNTLCYSRYQLELTNMLHGPTNIESYLFTVDSKLHHTFLLSTKARPVTSVTPLK